MNMSASQEVQSNQHPFYQDKIAWLPIFLFKEGDEHNSTKIAARWLCFLVCDAMSVGFDFNMDIDFNMFSIRIGIPYVNFYIRIPFPRKLDWWAHRNLWRVGSRSKYRWQR